MSPVLPHSLSSGSFKAFLHLVSSRWKSSLWNSTSAAHESTPTQPPSLLRALESNFLLIKFPLKAPVMPTSATLLYFFFFFSSSHSIILIFHEWYETLFTDIMRILFLSLLCFQNRYKYRCTLKWRPHFSTI